MLGVLINVVLIVIGSLAGLLLKKGIPEKVSKAVMLSIAICVTYVGLDGALEGGEAVVVILSMAVGTAIGTLLDIDGAMNKLGLRLESRLSKSGEKGSFAEGFVTSSLVFCVGAMAIIGALNSGLYGDHEILITKSVIDMISACMFASTMGIGVLFSAVAILLYEGGIALLSGALQTVLTNEALLANINCVGNLMIVAIGLNMLGAAKIKVADLLPALLIVPLAMKLMSLLSFM